jgi:decaprenylphospho-beta-D-erythro-pentofuranosid-2-ulose 2-reductase
MRVLIVGATAAISQASALALLQKEPTARFYLIGRSPEKLAGLQAQLQALRPDAVAGIQSLDLKELGAIPSSLLQAQRALGGPLDLCLIGHGTLIPQATLAQSPEALRQIFTENFISQAVILNNLLPLMRRGGAVGVVSSVAALAARPRSAGYSATKAALSRYIQGLRGSYDAEGVRLIDIRPGWVDTPMTAGSPSKFLSVAPSWAGRDIADALIRRWPRVLYTPWFWRYLMLPLRLIPAVGYERAR